MPDPFREFGGRASDPFARFGGRRGTGPGSSWQNPINEQGVTDEEREQINTLGLDPKSIVDWLQRKRGYEAHEFAPDEYAVRKPGERQWKKVDKSGVGDWIKDLTIDAQDEYAKMLAQVGGAWSGGKVGAAAGSVVPVYGTAVGAIGGAVLGAGLATGGVEATRRAEAKRAGFQESPSDFWKGVGEETAWGAASEAGGRALGYAAGKITGAGKDLIKGMHEGQTFTRGETQALNAGRSASDMAKAAKEAGIKYRPGMSAAELAEEIYQKQPGAEYFDTRNAKRAGEFIDKQSPGRFSETGEYQWTPGQEKPLNKLGQVAEDTKEYFTAEGYLPKSSKKPGRLYERRALYGQPPQMTFEDWLKVPYNDLRDMAKEAGRSDLLHAPKRELAEFAERYQPGGTMKVQGPEVTRGGDVKEDVRTVFDKNIPPFKDKSSGWRPLGLKTVQRLESESQGVLNFNEPGRMAKVGRLLTGKKSPLAESTLERVLGGASRLGEKMVIGGQKIAATGKTAAAGFGIPAALGLPGGSLAGAGAAAWATGKVSQAAGKVLARLPEFFARIVFDPKASPAVKGLATKALEALERGNEAGARYVVAILMHSKAFQQYLEGSGGT